MLKTIKARYHKGRIEPLETVRLSEGELVAVTIRRVEDRSKRLNHEASYGTLVDEVSDDFVADVGQANLRKRLKEGAVRHAERDQQLAKEWHLLEEEAWHGTQR